MKAKISIILHHDQQALFPTSNPQALSKGRGEKREHTYFLGEMPWCLGDFGDNPFLEPRPSHLYFPSRKDLIWRPGVRSCYLTFANCQSRSDCVSCLHEIFLIPKIIHGSALRSKYRRAGIRSTAHGVFPTPSRYNFLIRVLRTSVGAEGATIRYYIGAIPIKIDYNTI